jgi:hypothetical protein
MYSKKKELRILGIEIHLEGVSSITYLATAVRYIICEDLLRPEQ